LTTSSVETFSGKGEAAFPYETIERIRGNLISTDNSTAHLEVMGNDSPHYEDRAVLLCVPKGKFIADMPSDLDLFSFPQVNSPRNKRPPA
jgi:hypothetical protein